MNLINEKITGETCINNVFGVEGLVAAVFVTDWNQLPKDLTSKIEGFSKERLAARPIQVMNFKISPRLTDRYGVRSDATTVILFKDGQEMARNAEAKTTQEILPWLKRELSLQPGKPASIKAGPAEELHRPKPGA